MKKIFLTIAIFGSVFFLAQKSKTFLQIDYTSMCCGTPSTVPVTNYIESFQKKNSARPIEVFVQPGMGREGEFRLYLGIDTLSKAKRKKFIQGLEATVTSQNNTRNKNSDGSVFFTPSETVAKENLKKINNLTIYKKGNLR